MEQALTGKRVLVTQATEFMGPALCDVFARQGATVIASSEPLLEPAAAGQGLDLEGEVPEGPLDAAVDAIIVIDHRGVVE